MDKDTAVVTIQRYERGRQARTRSAAQNSEHEAAVTIQRHVRGHLARVDRKEHTSADFEDEGSAAAPKTDASMTEDEAATVIQSHVRGHLVRAQGEKHEGDAHPSSASMTGDEAATVIQSHVRGHLVRAQGAKHEGDAHPSSASMTEDEAATVVQSHVRGHLVRKPLQREKTEDSGVGVPVLRPSVNSPDVGLNDAAVDSSRPTCTSSASDVSRTATPAELVRARQHTFLLEQLSTELATERSSRAAADASARSAQSAAAALRADNQRLLDELARVRVEGQAAADAQVAAAEEGRRMAEEAAAEAAEQVAAALALLARTQRQWHRMGEVAGFAVQAEARAAHTASEAGKTVPAGARRRRPQGGQKQKRGQGGAVAGAGRSKGSNGGPQKKQAQPVSGDTHHQQQHQPPVKRDSGRRPPKLRALDHRNPGKSREDRGAGGAHRPMPPPSRIPKHAGGAGPKAPVVLSPLTTERTGKMPVGPAGRR